MMKKLTMKDLMTPPRIEPSWPFEGGAKFISNRDLKRREARQKQEEEDSKPAVDRRTPEQRKMDALIQVVEMLYKLRPQETEENRIHLRLLDEAFFELRNL